MFFLYFQEAHWEIHRLKCSKTQKILQNTAAFLYETTQIPEKGIIKEIKKCNAMETISKDGWSRMFSPTIDHCPKCKLFLSPVNKKKRRSTEDVSLLITFDHILPVDIYTKQCKLCRLIVKPDTLPVGLFNIGDIILISLDILFSLQNLVRCVNIVSNS